MLRELGVFSLFFSLSFFTLSIFFKMFFFLHNLLCIIHVFFTSRFLYIFSICSYFVHFVQIIFSRLFLAGYNLCFQNLHFSFQMILSSYFFQQFPASVKCFFFLFFHWSFLCPILTHRSIFVYYHQFA